MMDRDNSNQKTSHFHAQKCVSCFLASRHRFRHLDKKGMKSSFNIEEKLDFCVIIALHETSFWTFYKPQTKIFKNRNWF